MAKTTATIIGLTLAAVSIGVNTSRFPVVWQMADPRLASKASEAEAADVDPTLDPELVASNISSPSRPIEEDSTPQPIAPIANIAPIQDPVAQKGTDGDFVSKDDSDATDEWEDSPPVAEEPLVPVNFAGVSRSGDQAGGRRAIVQRLPPIVQDGRATNFLNLGGPMPEYPSTGIK